MRIRDHRTVDASWIEARYYGPPLDAQLGLYVVAHDTAGRSAISTAQYLADDPRGKASYHVIIEQDGGVIQQVPFNRRAHHAGVSAHPEKPWLIGMNRCSIGVAFDNPGALDSSGKAWFGERYASAEHVEHGERSGWWRPYTPAQIDTFEALVTALDRSYGLEGVFSHYAVATPRGRKNDTSPALEPMLQALNHSVEPKALDFVMPERGIVAAAGGLNLRAEPGMHGNVINVLPLHAGLNIDPPVMANGYVMVTTDGGQTGWVHSAYLQGA